MKLHTYVFCFIAKYLNLKFYLIVLTYNFRLNFGDKKKRKTRCQIKPPLH